MSNKFARRPTSQAYGLKPTFTTAPKHSGDDEETVVQDTVPSYKFADKQKGAIDTEAEARDKEDEEIRENLGKNPDDVEQPIVKFKPKTKRVVKNDKEDQPSTESTAGSFYFEAFWAREVDYDLEEVTHTVKNTWTPNAWGMFEILDAASIFVTDNRVIAKHHPNYLDYAVACYYSIMFYVQILRAQLSAGIISGHDSSFLRRFDRKFKPEELPITCILVPYFSSITSCLLPDSKYTWIAPAVADGIFRPTMAEYAYANRANDIVRGGAYIQPMVPYMLSILRTVITQNRQNHLADDMATTHGNAEQNNHNPTYFNDKEEYIPGRISDNAATALFGMNIQNGQARNDGRNTIFSTCGLSYPFHADFDTLNNAAPKWRRSSFASLRENNLADGTRVINDLEHFLHMEKEDDMEWFRELILQAGIHARFFGGVQSFSDVPTTGGLETLITALHKKGRTGHAVTFADVDLGLGTLANGSEPYYPRRFKDTVAAFYTTRNGYKRQEVLQAMSFGINATIYVGAGPNRVGEEATHYRKGPFWTNKEWTATRFAEAGQLGKPMFSGWRELIQTQFAKVKPQGY